MSISFEDQINLASERLGAEVLAANDEFFAEKENLIKTAEPIFLPDKYTDLGKWMDGWESRRKRVPGYDWCVLRLGVPGVVLGVDVNTAFFTGNYPEYCSIEGALGARDAKRDSLTWKEILPKVALKGDSHNLFPVTDGSHWSHLRLNIYPDGGVARLRVYGRVKPDWAALKATSGLIDLVSVEAGGRALACSDMHYSHPSNLTMPGRAKSMGDGWETKRRRGPGSDWAILKLGAPGKIKKIEVDTNHYKGNFPESCSIEACRLGAGELLPCDFRDRNDIKWEEILSRTPLKADHRHYYEAELKKTDAVYDHVRIHTYPDGGISRLRVHGELA